MEDNENKIKSEKKVYNNEWKWMEVSSILFLNITGPPPVD
jgi:hypothetical protein